MTLQWMKSLRGIAATGVAGALLASCGGGTQIESFKPTRIIAFGDEASYVHTDGNKFTVNAVVMDTTVTPQVPKTPLELDCLGNQVWVQQLAYSFNLSFDGRCPGTGYSANGEMLAENGATVDDVAAQVTSFLAGDGFNGKDLVGFMVGTHDIKNAIENNVSDPLAVAGEAGTRAAEQVIRITDRGAKVIVSTVPDLGLTPWAAARGPATVELATQLTQRFNSRLRLKLQDVRDGGHAVGLVLADEIVLAMTRFPVTYSISNVTQRFCSVQILADTDDCNMTTRNTGVAATSYGVDYLWADDYRLGGNAQGRIGESAVNRAHNNPF